MSSEDPDRRLRETEQQLHSVVTGAPVVLFALDRSGIFTLSEGAGLKMLGLQPGEAVGQSVFALYEYDSEVLDSVRRALSGEPLTTVLEVGELTFAVQYSPQFGRDGDVDHVIGVATDITEQTRAEADLQRRLAFEHLIRRVSTHFIRLAPDHTATTEEIDGAVRQALREMVVFVGADRGYMSENSDDPSNVARSYQWSSVASDADGDHLGDLAIEPSPWLAGRIEVGEVVQVPSIEDLPMDATTDRERWEHRSIRSLLALPLVSGGKIVGHIGLEWVGSARQSWPPDEASQFSVIQNLFANALQYKMVGAALQRANRVLRAVLECSDALTRARDEDVLLNEICRIVVEVGGYRMAWVGFGEGDVLRSIKPVAQWGFDDGYLASLNITWADTERGRGPMGKAIRTRSPAAVQNIATDPDFEPWRDEAVQRGYQSVLAVSLVSGDELLGAFIVYSADAGAFDTLEVEILQRFADYLSYGIVALRTRARRELIEEQLRVSLRSKDQLIASVSHELRTPLTTVVGFAQVLRDEAASGLTPEDRAEMIKAIVEESLDLTNIVEDLLTAAKAEAGTLTVVSVPVDLRAQASQVLEALSSQNIARIEITGTSEKVLGDPGRVRQILRNLISNALRYGGDQIQVIIGADSSHLVQVRDNGPGVPFEERERMFDPYQRAHNAPGVTASMGLGLTISRSLARLMEGDLEYRYEDDESVFEMTLPQAP